MRFGGSEQVIAPGIVISSGSTRSQGAGLWNTKKPLRHHGAAILLAKSSIVGRRHCPTMNGRTPKSANAKIVEVIAERALRSPTTSELPRLVGASAAGLHALERGAP